MKEREIIKAEKFNVLAISGVIGIIGVIIAILTPIIYSAKYAAKFNSEDQASKDYYKSALGYGIGKRSDMSLFIFLGIAVIVVIVAAIIFFSYSKVEMTVTDGRVYGRAKFGKRVDLPFDSISAVGTTMMNGIVVSTASGAIKFKFIKNRDEIHDAVSKLLLERQGKEKPVATTTIKQEIPQSNADELQKFKNLLDNGTITQEEFDAKKKQLLGL